MTDSKRTVFHIDDDEDDREFFADAFGESGATLCSFPSFQKALAATRVPDVIYMDFWVPGMTAGQFLKEMAAKADLASVPIHIISGTEVPLFFRELLDRYKVTYHLKPSGIAALRTLIRSTDGETAV